MSILYVEYSLQGAQSWCIAHIFSRSVWGAALGLAGLPSTHTIVDTLYTLCERLVGWRRQDLKFFIALNKTSS